MRLKQRDTEKDGVMGLWTSHVQLASFGSSSIGNFCHTFYKMMIFIRKCYLTEQRWMVDRNDSAWWSCPKIDILSIHWWFNVDSFLFNPKKNHLLPLFLVPTCYKGKENIQDTYLADVKHDLQESIEPKPYNILYPRKDIVLIFEHFFQFLIFLYFIFSYQIYNYSSDSFIFCFE